MFDPTDYTNVRLPLDQAETLPSHCYTSPEFFSREVDRLFGHAWHFAGRADELSQPGDTRCIDTVAGSCIVVRGNDGTLRSFINACRHRGTRLVDSDDPCRNFICPYHSWTYALDGSLRGAPGMDGVKGFRTDDFALQPVRLEQWGGFVFVQFERDAPDLVDWLGDLPEQMAGHDPATMRTTRSVSFQIQSNWKFLIENALEAYHTGTVHRATLGAQDSSSTPTAGNWDALYVPSEPDKTLATLPGETDGFPFIPTLQGAASRGTFFTVIYPCTQIVFAQDCIWWLDFKPLDVTNTQLTLGSSFPADVVAAESFEEKVKAYYARWDNATPEDNAIAEAQHRGHASGLKLPGRYALTEHCVHKLNNWVLDRVLDPSVPG